MNPHTTHRTMRRLLLAALVVVAACGTAGGDITGRTWQLIELESEPIPTEILVDLTYDESTITGSGGCNRYTGSATFEDGDVSIDGPIARTERACSPAIDDVEQRYFSTLESATGYGVTGDDLTLTDAAGQVIARFNAGSPQTQGS